MSPVIDVDYTYCRRSWEVCALGEFLEGFQLRPKLADRTDRPTQTATSTGSSSVRPSSQRPLQNTTESSLAPRSSSRASPSHKEGVGPSAALFALEAFCWQYLVVPVAYFSPCLLFWTRKSYSLLLPDSRCRQVLVRSSARRPSVSLSNFVPPNARPSPAISPSISPYSARQLETKKDKSPSSQANVVNHHLRALRLKEGGRVRRIDKEEDPRKGRENADNNSTLRA